MPISTYDDLLGEDEAGVAEYELCSEVLRIAVCYDQLDVSNLATFERLLRRVQLIEESHRQKLEEKKLEKGMDLVSTISEQFAGRTHMAGGAIVSPTLLKHATEKAAQSNEILKQQRKAAEARVLPKKK